MADEITPASAADTATAPPPVSPAAAAILSSAGASDQPPGSQPMLTPSGASDQPDITSMLTPAGASDYIPPSAAQSAYSAPAPVSQDVHEHLSWMHRALDRVGTLLGGDTTYKITKGADGSETIEQQPSTTGEKWGRIAAAAIAGAGAGLAHAQGPGGLARAAGAGIETGAGLPQQAQQMRQQQVDFANKQMLSHANYLHTKQETYMLGAQGKLLDMKYSEEMQKMVDQHLAALTDDPNAKVVATGIDPRDTTSLTELSKKIPNLAKLIAGNGNQEIVAVPAADGKFDLVLKDKAWLDRKTDKEKPVYSLVRGDDGTWDFKQTDTVPAGRMTNRDYETHFLSTFKEGSAALKSLADANKPDKAPAALDTSGKTLNAWRLEKDPDKKDQLWKQYQTQRRDELALRGREEGGGAGGGFVASNPQETEQFLKTLPPGDAATVRAIGEIRQQPPSRYSKEGMRIMELVNRAYPDYDATNYANYAKTKLDYAPGGTTGKGLNFIGTALAHMDRMEANVDALHNVSTPVVGPWWNAVKNAAQKGTSPAIKRFVDDQKAVTSEIARAYNGGAITQGERDHMMDLISTSDSPDAIRASLGEFRELLNGKLDQYRMGWDAQMPRGQRNAVLDQLTARGTAYRQPAPETPAAAPAATTETPGDAGKGTSAPPTDGKGAPWDANVWRHLNPGKDAKPVIKWAKDHNFTVVNE